MRELLTTLFNQAVTVALPQQRLAKFLPPPPTGKTIVVGGGKSAALMAKVVEDNWEQDLTGLVITRYGHRVKTDKIQVKEASHPIPDHNAVEGTQQIFNLVSNLTPHDLVICLLSGGGSALLTLPPPELNLEDVINIHQQLLRCGANIKEINTVRKHLSLSAGGRLAIAAYPAQVVSLIISDVPGDDLTVIASGPTIGDSITSTDALAILHQYQIPLSPHLQQYLTTNPSPVILPEDKRLHTVQNLLIATPEISLESAANLAQTHGYNTLILSDSIQGEAKEVGIVHAGIVQQIVRHRQPLAPPCVMFSGGETTVTLSKQGKGGPNSEFLLSLAIALDGLPHVYAIACDTDGIDGSENNAGAIITPFTLQQARELGLNPQEYLTNHDSYSFFAQLNSLVITGPTLTNVNDFRAILVTRGRGE
ncbi:MAG: glycerate kinase [Gloeocapsa sp. DLM2.Bin57]|nr:MAG: glycerate kinase [Gloeocapsa sp. DLM2.Bin57]